MKDEKNGNLASVSRNFSGFVKEVHRCVSLEGETNRLDIHGCWQLCIKVGRSREPC